MKYVVTVLLLSLCVIKASGEEKVVPPADSVITLDYDSAETAGIVRNEELIELSGVVVGGVNKDILWVHNDRQNAPRLYALNMKGETVATYIVDSFSLKKPSQMLGDWEDIARMPGLTKGMFELYIADIGNNGMQKIEHRIIVVSEPTVDPDKSSQPVDIKFKSIRFKFPEEYRCNNECLLIHPVTKKTYIVSKGVTIDGKKVTGSFVWSLPEGMDCEKVYTAKLVTDSVPAIDGARVTGGDISSDGQYLILRETDKFKAYLWKLGENFDLKQVLSSEPTVIPLAPEKNGEAICFSFDHSRLFTVYDGKKKNRPLHVYPKK